MRKCLTFIRWSSFVMIPLLLMLTQGYSRDLFETHLTVVSSSAYSSEVEGKISIHDTGAVELSIKGLRSADDQLINQNSILFVDVEINDSPETYSRSFDIVNGGASLEFTLEGLSKGDKVEIVGVVINKAVSPIPSPTPTTTASPTPTHSPIATPVATPTPSLARAVSDLAILAPGGIIAVSTAPTPTPTATPGVINADVEIKPETINLKGNGKFKAFIKFESDSSYDVNDIVAETVECEGAKAIDGKVDKNRFVATFNVQDLDVNSQTTLYRGQKNGEKERQELTVIGELEGGIPFEGSDTVKIRDRGKGHDDDDDDNGDDDDDDDDGHGKKRHH